MRTAERILGQRFGRLRVVACDPVNLQQVICRCDCGKIKKVAAYRVYKGVVKSCGCLMRRLHHLTLEDILKHCDKRGPDECWPWTGTMRNNGYGAIRFQRIEMVATRAVMTAIHGPIPGDLIVCHKCDNPPCVNPKHLFIGTYRDNVLDMLAKGRGNHRGGGKLKYCRSGRHLLDETAYSAPGNPTRRICGVCMLERQREWKRKKYAEQKLTPPSPPESAGEQNV